MDSYLELYLPSGLFATSDDDRDTTTRDARTPLPSTPTMSGYFFIGAETFDANSTGAYTLSVAQASVALTAGGRTTTAARLQAAMEQMRMAPPRNWAGRMRAILSTAGASRRRPPKPPR